jgi:hypothetical protein
VVVLSPDSPSWRSRQNQVPAGYARSLVAYTTHAYFSMSRFLALYLCRALNVQLVSRPRSDAANSHSKSGTVRNIPSLSRRLRYVLVCTPLQPHHSKISEYVHHHWQNYTEKIHIAYRYVFGARGSILVKALCYKPEGRGFETRWGEWNFSIYLILPAALGPGISSASNRTE